MMSTSVNMLYSHGWGWQGSGPLKWWVCSVYEVDGSQVLPEISSEQDNQMWLDLWKPVQIVQEPKSILLPNIKTTL